MSETQIITLIIAILGVLHGPLVTNLFKRDRSKTGNP